MNSLPATNLTLTISFDEPPKRTRTTHGKCPRRGPSKKYTAWRNIKQRTCDPNHRAYKDYGARGIGMHGPWCESFAQFDKDVPDPPEDSFNCTIDRIDNDRGYEPGNIRWADRKTQANNTRKQKRTLVTYDGRTQTITQWAEELNILKGTLYHRIYLYGMTVEQAFTQPLSPCWNNRARGKKA